jgi:YD repeat-containing protein
MGDTLSFTSSPITFTFTARDGTVAVFAGPVDPRTSRWPQLSSIKRPNGTKLTFDYAAFSYSGVTYELLTSVTNNFGYQLYYGHGLSASTSPLFPYYVSTVTGLNNRVEACAPIATTCAAIAHWNSQFITPSGSPSTGQTMSVKDALNYTTTFAGNADNVIVNPATYTITRPSGHWESVTGAWMATSIIAPPASITNFSSPDGNWIYSWTPMDISTYLSQKTATDPLSGITKLTTKFFRLNATYPYYFGISPRPTVYTDPLNRTSTYGYDSFGRVTSVTHPLGNNEVYTYDGRGNITQVTNNPVPGSGLTATTVSADYDPSCVHPAKCNQPNFIIYARGARTDYTYDN